MTYGTVWSWTLEPAAVRSILRRAAKIAIDSRASMVTKAMTKAAALAKFEPQGVVVGRLDAVSEEMQYECAHCSTICTTKAALAVHASRRHGLRPDHASAFGTECPVCQQQYWSTGMLREHLRRSHACGAAFAASDIVEATSEVRSAAQQPVVPLIGPKPFWAARAPPPGKFQIACAPSAPVVAFSAQLAEVHCLDQVPALLRQWGRPTFQEEVELTCYSCANSCQVPLARRFAAELVNFCVQNAVWCSFSKLGITAVRTLLGEDWLMRDMGQQISLSQLFA